MESRQINEVGAPMEVRARSLPRQASSILDALDGPADVEDGRNGESSLASPVGGDS